MTTMNFELEKAALAREILNSDNEEMLIAVRTAIQQVKAKFVHKEDCLTKAEVLAGFDQACKQIKQRREGKLIGKPAEELLNEL